jgi:hypothetical protein
MVRAKMKVDAVTYAAGEMCTVVLSPVINGSDENKTFYKFTPGGKVEMQVVAPETAKQFEPGKEYYVDFTPAV